MPPRKQKKTDVSLQKLQNNVALLEKQLALARGRVSVTRPGTGNRVVSTAEAKLQAAKAALRDAEHAINPSKRTKQPNEVDFPPPKRLKGVQPSDEDTMDMELELLDQEAERMAEAEANHLVVEKEHTARVEAERCSRETEEAIKVAADRVQLEECVALAEAERIRNEEKERAVQLEAEHLENEEKKHTAQVEAERVENEGKVHMASVEAEHLVQERRGVLVADVRPEDCSAEVTAGGTPNDILEHVTTGGHNHIEAERITSLLPGTKASGVQGKSTVPVASNDAAKDASFETRAARLMFDLIYANSRPLERQSRGSGAGQGGAVALDALDMKNVLDGTFYTFKSPSDMKEPSAATSGGLDTKNVLDGALYRFKSPGDENEPSRTNSGCGNDKAAKGMPGEEDSVSSRLEMGLDEGVKGYGGTKLGADAGRYAAAKEDGKGKRNPKGKALQKVAAASGEEGVSESSDDEDYTGAVVAMLKRQRQYEDMSDKEKKVLDASALNQIRIFMKDTTKPMRVDTRLMLRDIPDFLPEAAMISRDVTCHILTTKQNNIRCLYHIMNRRMDKSDLDVGAARLKTEKGELSLTGVAGWPNRKKEHKILFRKTRQEGIAHLDCGCGIEEALFHFWMWKTWRLRGEKGMVVEPINAAHITPRLRNVIHQGFKVWGGLPDGIQAVFAGAPANAIENRERMIVAQVQSLVAELGVIYADRHEPLTAQVLLDILAQDSEHSDIGEEVDAGDK